MLSKLLLDTKRNISDFSLTKGVYITPWSNKSFKGMIYYIVNLSAIEFPNTL